MLSRNEVYKTDVSHDCNKNKFEKFKRYAVIGKHMEKLKSDMEKFPFIKIYL